jgi:hypothetical protein
MSKHTTTSILRSRRQVLIGGVSMAAAAGLAAVIPAAMPKRASASTSSNRGKGNSIFAPPSHPAMEPL